MINFLMRQYFDAMWAELLIATMAMVKDQKTEPFFDNFLLTVVYDAETS